MIGVGGVDCWHPAGEVQRVGQIRTDKETSQKKDHREMNSL